MKPVWIAALFGLLAEFPLRAQVCPGGGLNFSVAVPFDPAWIYGCNTGTSCNGGVAFDNRISCQPTTSLDACAPAPSCGTIGWNASNVWFTFYASGPTALISCFQNTSLVLGIQAFSGGPACGSLTQLGCAISGGPSSGVQLSLSGLHYGQLYYFRIFGSANPVSQRTGLYCFCGSKGLNDFTILPVNIIKFKATAGSEGISISWATPDSLPRNFDAERSGDGIQFSTIHASIERNGNSYAVIDRNASAGVVFYRIRQVYPDGRVDYSPVITVKSFTTRSFAVMGNIVDNKMIRISATASTQVDILDMMGRWVGSLYLKAGSGNYALPSLKKGMYLLQERKGRPLENPVKMLVTSS